MGLIDYLTTRANVQSPSVPLTSRNILSILGEGLTASSGVVVNEQSVIGYPAVLRAITKLSRDVARMPFNVFRRLDDNKFRDVSHPAERLLNISANPLTKAVDLRQTLTAHALLRGNGYAVIQRDGMTPVGLVPLSPSDTWLSDAVSEDGDRAKVYVTTTFGRMEAILPQNILHIRGLSWDGTDGIDNLERLKESIGLGLAAQKQVSVQFRNNGRPGVVIEVPYRFRDEKHVDEFRRKWGEVHGGVENANRPAILEKGASVKPISISNQDNQVLEMREFEVKQIANIFSIPVYLLQNTETTSFASVEQMQLAYRDDIDPWLTQWERECQNKLLSLRQKERRTHLIEHNRSHLIKTDIKTQSEVLVNEVNNGLISVNEARSIKNLNAVDGGDIFRQPLNIGVSGGQSEEEESMPVEDQPMGGDRSKLAENMRKIVQAEAEVMLRRLCGATMRATRSARQFMTYLDEFDDKHGRNYEALRPAISNYTLIVTGSTGDADGQVRSYLEKFRQQLWDLSGEVGEDLLSPAVEEFVQRQGISDFCNSIFEVRDGIPI